MRTPRMNELEFTVMSRLVGIASPMLENRMDLPGDPAELNLGPDGYVKVRKASFDKLRKHGWIERMPAPPPPPPGVTRIDYPAWFASDEGIEATVAHARERLKSFKEAHGDAATLDDFVSRSDLFKSLERLGLVHVCVMSRDRCVELSREGERVLTGPPTHLTTCREKHLDRFDPEAYAAREDAERAAETARREERSAAFAAGREEREARTLEGNRRRAARDAASAGVSAAEREVLDAAKAAFLQTGTYDGLMDAVERLMAREEELVEATERAPGP